MVFIFGLIYLIQIIQNIKYIECIESIKSIKSVQPIQSAPAFSVEGITPIDLTIDENDQSRTRRLG